MSKAADRVDMGDLLLCVATFAVLALLALFGVSTERTRLEQDLRANVSQQALHHIGRLEAELNANVFLANGMAAHIVAHNGQIEETVVAAMRTLHEYGRHIRNIGIAPGNRISNVYPLEGNQAAIGLYYPDNPAQWAAVKRSIDIRNSVLAGPVNLKQGGTALVSRTPVFLPGGRYWGVISLALDTESLLSAVGIAPEVDGIRYALRGKDAMGKAGDVFMGAPELFNEDSVVFDLGVPGGMWQLAARPVEGWEAAGSDTVVLEAAGLAVAFGISLAVHVHLRNRRRVADSELRLRAFLDTTKDAVIVIDDHGLVQEFNRAAERMFGYSAAEMAGASLNALMPADPAEQHDSYILSPRAQQSREMTTGQPVHGRRRDGSEFPIEVTVGEARVAGRRMHVGVVRDITERQAFEQKLVEAATIDALTGALNRRAFMEAAHAAVTLARRHDRPLSLLMLDADHFKAVNDTYGHHMGDAVLMRLAAVARTCVRGSDSFGRLGGEEFAILLPETSAERAVEVAERLLAAVRQAQVTGDDGVIVTFTVSIGLAALTPATTDEDALLRRADRALYCAKSLGRDRWYPADDNT